MKNAIYAGSFDPFTKGHEDVLLKALDLFDTITLVVGYNSEKPSGLLDPMQRVMSIKKYLDENNLKDKVNVSSINENGVLVDYANTIGAQFLIRGIRTVSDFENEMSMTAMNQILDENIHTVFFMPNAENQFTSSSKAREFIRLKKFEKVEALLPKPILDFILTC